MAKNGPQSRTVLLVHGAWVTPQCWAGFKGLYEARGYKVVVPHWPYMNRPVELLRDRPDPDLKTVTIKDLVDHYEREIRLLDAPPIIMGHSFGGLIVQMLLDRGLGHCGVAFDAAPPRGVVPSFRAVRSALPVLLAWEGWNRILSMSFSTFANTFANTLPNGLMRATYDEHIVPAPGRIYFQAALGIGNAVNFRSSVRPPLLLVAASEDRTSTPSMVQAMYLKHSKALSTTTQKEFPSRSHWLIAEQGWEEVATFAIEWTEKAEPPMPRATDHRATG